ncbi:LPS export ABC transporter periplasmic protein LptC [Limnohabitans sp. Jir72]|uniref:LPS export ABC transporter periplasmic protein LptC n=1 Tax=Limnohabitans sp. Jir72 TaxID=1977909 RepID=UPI001E659F17|nr:LPS export ABC transporter periplasmic protein LptC [Limnohabitans sp. Jir72]
MKVISLFRRFLDRLSLYLPLILMGFLALASWWLVRSMPVMVRIDENKPLRKDPDYRLENFSVKSFDTTGRMTREVLGDKGRHFPDVDDMHIDNVRVYSESDTGVKIYAQAQTGIATGDGERVTLIGNAQAIRPADAQSPRTELRGERLVALAKENRLLSSDPVEITRDKDVFTALTLNFNSKSGIYLLEGRVRGMLAAKP